MEQMILRCENERTLSQLGVCFFIWFVLLERKNPGVVSRVSRDIAEKTKSHVFSWLCAKSFPKHVEKTREDVISTYFKLMQQVRQEVEVIEEALGKLNASLSEQSDNALKILSQRSSRITDPHPETTAAPVTVFVSERDRTSAMDSLQTLLNTYPEDPTYEDSVEIFENSHRALQEHHQQVLAAAESALHMSHEQLEKFIRANVEVRQALAQTSGLSLTRRV